MRQDVESEILEQYANSDALQFQARQAAQKTLELSEELQGIVFNKMRILPCARMLNQKLSIPIQYAVIKFCFRRRVFLPT